MIDGIIPVTNDKLNNLNDEVIRFGKLLNNLNALKEMESDEIIIKFERMYRGDKSRQKIEGGGIGLTIAKKY